MEMNATPISVGFEVHLGEDISHPNLVGMDLWVGGDLKEGNITRFHELAL